MIDSTQENEVLQKIKNQYRNRFSHYASDMILKEYPNEDYWDDKKEDPMIKANPTFQFKHVQDFIKKNSLDYLIYVVNLISSIEKKLIEKYPGNLVVHKFEGGFLRVVEKGKPNKNNNNVG